MLPATCSLSVGADTPTPTFPLAKIVKSDVPVDDATLNGLRLEVDVACTLNANDDEVALIPANTPLSKSVDVPNVVEVSHRVAKPNTPPDTPEPPVIPRDDVATQRVEVPVVWSIIPRVPVALSAS
jgi:hypothetical protein